MSVDHARGFTLLEILVVLVLTSIVTGLLLQGLEQVFRLERHFGAETYQTQQGAMQASWYRQSVNGLVPDYVDGKHRFRGDRNQIDGLTIIPIDSLAGRPVPLSLRLRFDSALGETRLHYGASDDAPVIMSWRGNSGRFVYLDAKLEAHDTWPPFLGQWPQLPWAIRLETEGTGLANSVIAVPKGPTTTIHRLGDVERM